MNNSYLYITNLCNQNCKCCPYSFSSKRKAENISLEFLDRVMEKLKRNNVKGVTISGGEPTMHPFFFDIVKKLADNDFKIGILSNSEKFSNEIFVGNFKNINTSSIYVITTLHSYKREEHEKENLKIGSFDKTINGLKNLSKYNVRFMIKHCITKKNHAYLSSFLDFINDNFEESVGIQLCGIDFLGIELKDAIHYFAPFETQSIDIMKMLDKNNNKRYIEIINFPLCYVDPFYWSHFKNNKNFDYRSYVKQEKIYLGEVDMNVDINEESCKDCIAKDFCPGTYKKTYELFGNDVVRSIKE